MAHGVLEERLETAKKEGHQEVRSLVTDAAISSGSRSRATAPGISIRNTWISRMWTTSGTKISSTRWGAEGMKLLEIDVGSCARHSRTGWKSRLSSAACGNFGTSESHTWSRGSR